MSVQTSEGPIRLDQDDLHFVSGSHSFAIKLRDEGEAAGTLAVLMVLTPQGVYEGIEGAQDSSLEDTTKNLFGGDMRRFVTEHMFARFNAYIAKYTTPAPVQTTQFMLDLQALIKTAQVGPDGKLFLP